MISQELKVSTSEKHRLLENLPLNRHLMSRNVRLEDYAQILDLLYAIHLHLEKKIYFSLSSDVISQLEFNSHSTALLKDLKELGIEEPKTTDRSWPESISNPSQALGCCYVLQGSLLGGIVIMRHLEKTFSEHIVSCPFHYYGQWADSPSFRWKNFTENLNKISYQSLFNRDDIIHGGRLTFDVFIDTFSFQGR